MLIIGLSGKAGAGKDTAANILESRFNRAGVSTSRISFAKPIKDICTLMFGWDRKRLDTDPYYKEGGLGGWVPKGAPGAVPLSYEQLKDIVHSDSHLSFDMYVQLDTDPACVKLGKTRRTVMQQIGTEGMREVIHPDVWIICTELAIDRGELNSDVGFVTDCRFLNEMQFIRNQKGLLVQVQRPDVGTLTSNTQHESELQWLNWNGGWEYIVTNPGNASFADALDPIIDFYNKTRTANVG